MGTQRRTLLRTLQLRIRTPRTQPRRIRRTRLRRIRRIRKWIRTPQRRTLRWTPPLLNHLIWFHHIIIQVADAAHQAFLSDIIHNRLKSLRGLWSKRSDLKHFYTLKSISIANPLDRTRYRLFYMETYRHEMSSTSKSKFDQCAFNVSTFIKSQNKFDNT